MSSLGAVWSRIATKLYLALGTAVLLTLLSAGVGVFYFERSGDLNHRVQSEAVPASRDASEVSRVSLELGLAGSVLLAEARAGSSGPVSADVDGLLSRLEESLSRPAGLPGMAGGALAVHEAAFSLAGALDGLLVDRESSVSLALGAASLGESLDSVPRVGPGSELLPVLYAALRAPDMPALDRLWAEYQGASGGAPAGLAALAEDDVSGVFAVRSGQLLLAGRLLESEGELALAREELSSRASSLRESVDALSESRLAESVSAFDRGRALLAAISLASVVLATLTAWVWVGNGIVRRLSRLSERMRDMARGDFETPVPEVGYDEIGRLADDLEVFRHWALEVQRLNLVERLYGELREAHEELGRMQERLVAQEKLAALGELVSGVAHELSNPLSFVKNFSEGTGQLSEELFEMLENYREGFSDDDVGLLDDVKGEMEDSLERVRINSLRALTIVRRMQSIGVAGGDPRMTDLHAAVQRAVQVGCDSFRAEWQDFEVEPRYDFSGRVGEAAIVSQDFAEAVVNLVSNACYAMRMRREQEDGPYAPELLVSSGVSEDGVRAELRFRDNGTGIHEDVIGHIFNPFFTTRDGALGAGLGLPLAADVARRGGGDLTVETGYGVYTEFTLTVPLDLPSAVPAGAASARLTGGSSPSSPGGNAGE